ncbi:MAG: acid phosphatase [Burkholderiales bacterium PBB5]|nr:MAG: acid phosphatase [Burkholderiales bacterium PBB5]
MPDRAALLPAPPARGSPAAAADEAAHRALASQRATTRWQRATADAELLKWPQATASFACTLGMPITEHATPHLAMLLRRTLGDAGLATYAAKDSYQRTRPYVSEKETTCHAADEKSLAKDGSYPSGHAALGWAWALILAELAPERADALLQRGHAFGQSRVVCGYHWQSDVDHGRQVGAAAVARLHADPTFTAQAALAKAEIDAARAQGLKSPGNCAAEAQALAR